MDHEVEELDISPNPDPLTMKSSQSLQNRLRKGIMLQLQFVNDLENDTKNKKENDEYMITCTNKIRAKLTQISAAEEGQTFDLYVMKNNRKKLMNYVFDKHTAKKWYKPDE